MSLFRAALTNEAVTQYRSGLSALYIGMPFVWILLARLLPEDLRPAVALIGSYSDPVMMGALFTGAFLARERDQGLLEAWAVSPLGAGEWLAARCLLIGIQGSLGGLLLAYGSGVPFRVLFLIPGLFLAAVCGALLGLIMARPFKDILNYFVLGGIGSAMYNLPIAGILLNRSLYWMLPGPAASGWLTLAAAFSTGEKQSIVQNLLYPAILAGWTVILFLICRRIYLRGFFRIHGAGSPI